MEESSKVSSQPGKTPKAQLSKGMEHMRQYVTVDVAPSSTTTTTTTTSPPIIDDQLTSEVTSTPTDTDTNTDSNIGAPAYGVPATLLPKRHPQTTTSKQNPQQRADPFQFGSRYLEEGDDIFAHNAWDHVEVDSAYTDFITQQTLLQRSAPVSDFDAQRFNTHPEKFWDKFYGNNRANFFKDRKWLVQEFPILGEVTKEGYGEAKVLEVGAGAGNTAFPVLANNRNPRLRIHACDYSKKAIEVIRGSEAYAGQDVLRADVWDVAGSGEGALPPGVERGSVDVVIMIFVFSALQPRQWLQAVRNVWDVLKPGGVVLFRDYGRGDLAQVRFKKGRYLEENFYIRGDGTRVYFFEEEELRDIWSGKMPPNARVEEEKKKKKAEHEEDEAVEKKLESVRLDDDNGDATPVFEITQLGVDRRMLVNRQRKLKMYRCWMQGRFEKPAVDSKSETA